MITSWDQVPLVLGIAQTADVLGRSVRSIQRDLSLHRMEPAPLPMIGARVNQRRLWSKSALQAFLDGGYLQFEQQARRKSRHYFGKAKARVA